MLSFRYEFVKKYWNWPLTEIFLCQPPTFCWHICLKHYFPLYWISFLDGWNRCRSVSICWAVFRIKHYFLLFKCHNKQTFWIKFHCMELSSAVNYIFHGRFTPLTEKIQYVAAFLLQIKSSASQQISFLSAAVLLWHSSGLLPSFAIPPFMSRSTCKYLKTINNIIATWMHAQKKPQRNNTEQKQFQNSYTYIMYIMQIYTAKEHSCHSQRSLTHGPAFFPSHGGSLPSYASLPHHPSDRTCRAIFNWSW